MDWIHHHLDEVTSTNDWTLAWLKSHALDVPIIVTTDRQTHGRGQRSKRWEAPAKSGVAMSVAVPRSRWPEAAFGPVTFSMEVALAVLRALRAASPQMRLEAAPDVHPPGELLLKWPNDVLAKVDGRWAKLAGILIENQWRGNTWVSSVVGVGVNVRAHPHLAEGHATSLHDVWGEAPSPAELAQSIAHELLRMAPGPGTSAAYHENLAGLGVRRAYVVNGRTVWGVLEGIDANGQAHFTWEPSSTTDGMAMPRRHLDVGDVGWVWS